MPSSVFFPSTFPTKLLLFAFTFFSHHHHHRWTSQALGGKVVNEGDTLFHLQWSQGGDWLKWEQDQQTAKDETESASQDSSSSSASSTASTQDSASASSAASEGDEWVQILSADDEPFRCIIPKPRGTPKERSQSYEGPSPLSILNELFQKGSCSYRIESYWTYEVCHGKYVRQVSAKLTHIESGRVFYKRL